MMITRTTEDNAWHTLLHAQTRLPDACLATPEMYPERESISMPVGRQHVVPKRTGPEPVYEGTCAKQKQMRLR